MTRISVRTRVFSYGIAASVEELDSLVRKMQQLCDVEREPHWELRLPKYDSIDVWGFLGAVDDVDLTQVRRFVCWVGSSFDDRHATLEVLPTIVRLDVWHESAERSKEVAAILKSRLDDVRPWWAFVKTIWGYLILYAAFFGLACLAALIAGLGLPSPVVLTLAGIAAVAAILGSRYMTPILTVGRRQSGASVWARLGIWLLSAAGAGAIGVGIAWALARPFGG